VEEGPSSRTGPDRACRAWPSGRGYRRPCADRSPCTIRSPCTVRSICTVRTTYRLRTICPICGVRGICTFYATRHPVGRIHVAGRRRATTASRAFRGGSRRAAGV